jgi:hypothetical protein
VFILQKFRENGIVICILWVDDCLLIGHKEEVSKYKDMMQQYFECEDIGELKEYVGCKIDRGTKRIRV